MNLEKQKELERVVRTDYGNITGIVVHKNGETAYEGYFHGYTRHDAVHVYSVTKSIFSALIGIAVGSGLIKGVEQRVLDFFPDYAGQPVTPDVTIRHLLTMTAPCQSEPEPFEAFFESDHWLNFALDYVLGGRLTGEFRYSPIIAAHILSGILAGATGRPVLDFAVDNLFSPLAIHVSRNVALPTREEHLAWSMQGKHAGSWAVDPQGLNTATWGLTLTPADMAKIGQLYLNGGMWKGARILSAEWVDASTEVHSRWEEAGLSYGYLWWILHEESRVFAAMGDGGNVIYVDSGKQLVVAIASLYQGDPKDRVALIQQHIEPIL